MPMSDTIQSCDYMVIHGEMGMCAYTMNGDGAGICVACLCNVVIQDTNYRKYEGIMRKQRSLRPMVAHECAYMKVDTYVLGSRVTLEV